MTTPYVPPPREIHIPPWLSEQWENPILPQPPPPPPITAADLAEAAANRESARTNWQPAPTVPVSQGSTQPVPTRQPGPWHTLPATARPEVPKPSKDFTLKGLRIAWDGAKWIAKTNPWVRGAWYAFEAYGAIMTATDLAKWAAGINPSYKPPPRVDTGYVFSGGGTGMTYKHFDGSWQRFPPPGYDRFGALMQ